ncbi:MAG: protein-L-isoaspartate(D-aspartate) O-methyltransferase [Candidatus Woesearchaeota archaeon]|nr:MAG: protein-L-isoaspartate(D-aspartate) O-methyltransferase [Candidatus Woesearchaeota archaeon]
MEKKKLLKYWKNNIIRDERILKVLEKVPRENFILEEHKDYAYVDEPLPILKGQTISQPTTVAFMTQALEPKKGQRILEIGAGSGYQAAILSEIVGTKGKIITVERIYELFEYAKDKLKDYSNVEVILGDGSKGYEKESPYDRIIVTAAAPNVPDPLFDQLKENGILLIPVGGGFFGQKMLRVKKIKGKKEAENLGSFIFVPLIGEFGFK